MTSAAQLHVTLTGRAGEGLVWAPDGSGWSAFGRSESDEGALIFLRFAFTATAAAIVVRDALLSSSLRGLGSKDLRGLPMGRLTSAVNRPAELRLLSTWLLPLHAPAVPFPEDLWVDEGMPWWGYSPQRPRAPRLRVTVPATHRKPDAFYEQVADRFAYLSGMSARPAADLAAANGVPVTTVHGWVKEARRRGLLASGERARRISGGNS